MDECVRALEASSWDVGQATKYLQLAHLARLGLADLRTCRAALVAAQWDMAMAADALVHDGAAMGAEGGAGPRAHAGGDYPGPLPRVDGDAAYSGSTGRYSSTFSSAKRIDSGSEFSLTLPEASLIPSSQLASRPAQASMLHIAPQNQAQSPFRDIELTSSMTSSSSSSQSAQNFTNPGSVQAVSSAHPTQSSSSITQIIQSGDVPVADR